VTQFVVTGTGVDEHVGDVEQLGKNAVGDGEVDVAFHMQEGGVDDEVRTTVDADGRQAASWPEGGE